MKLTTQRFLAAFSATLLVSMLFFGLYAVDSRFKTAGDDEHHRQSANHLFNFDLTSEESLKNTRKVISAARTVQAYVDPVGRMLTDWYFGLAAMVAHLLAGNESICYIPLLC